MPIPDFQTYGELVYTLAERYPSIRYSTLILASIGPTLAKLEGQETFVGDIVLDVWTEDRRRRTEDRRRRTNP